MPLVSLSPLIGGRSRRSSGNGKSHFNTALKMSCERYWKSKDYDYTQTSKAECLEAYKSDGYCIWIESKRLEGVPHYCTNPLTVQPYGAGPKAGKAGPEDSFKRGFSGGQLSSPRVTRFKGWVALFRALRSSPIGLYSKRVCTVCHSLPYSPQCLIN